MGCWRNRIEDNFPQTSPCDNCVFYKSEIKTEGLKESNRNSKNKMKVLSYICDKNQNIYLTYKDQTCTYYTKSQIQNE